MLVMATKNPYYDYQEAKYLLSQPDTDWTHKKLAKKYKFASHSGFTRMYGRDRLNEKKRQNILRTMAFTTATYVNQMVQLMIDLKTM